MLVTTPDVDGAISHDGVRVEGHFQDGELVWGSLFHEMQVGPLTGLGTYYEYRDGEVTREHRWIS